jgi:hypothetical protein
MHDLCRASALIVPMRVFSIPYSNALHDLSAHFRAYLGLT